MSDLPKLAAPARRALAAAGVETLDELSRWKANDLAALHGMGPNAMKTLKAALAKKGARFAG